MSSTSPRVRLGLFVALLAVAFGAAFGIGSAAPPVERAPMEAEHGEHG